MHTPLSQRELMAIQQEVAVASAVGFVEDQMPHTITRRVVGNKIHVDIVAGVSLQSYVALSVYPKLLKVYIDAFMKILAPLDYDFLAGLELGGIPWSVALGRELNKPVFSVRVHGPRSGQRDFAALSPEVRGARVVIIDDTLSLGNSLTKGVNILRAGDARVVAAVIAHRYRQEAPAEPIYWVNWRKRGFPVFAVSHAKDVRDQIRALRSDMHRE